MKPDGHSTRQGLRPGRLRNGVINGLLVLASLSVVLVVSELVLNIYEARLLEGLEPPAPCDPAAGVCESMPQEDQERLFAWRNDGNGLFHIKSRNRNLVYELRPSTRLNEAISTNSFGFRDREFTMDKAEEVYRIVVVGDSITFGWLERLENTYPKILEKMLNAHCGNGHRFEVYNMGIGGYNAAQELELTKTKAMRFHPDLVIVQYTINDNEVGADAGLWRHFSRGRLRTLDFIKLRWERLKERAESESLVERSYREIAHVSRETGVPVFVVLFPPSMGEPEQLAETYGFVRHLGLPCLDLTEAFTGFRSEMIMHVDGLHPNAVGHWIAAEELLRRLKSDFPDPFGDWCVAAGTAVDLARQHFRNGLKHQLEDRIQRAIEEYGKACDANSSYGILASTALINKAKFILWEQQDPMAAAELCMAAVKFDAENGPAHKLLGLTLKARGEVEDALKAYQRAVALGTEDYQTCLEIGDLLAATGRFGEAVEAYKAAVSRSEYGGDGAIDALEEAATTFMERERWSETTEALSAAFRLNPDGPHILSNVGVALAREGHLDAAVQLWREVIAIDPESWYAFHHFDRAFSEKGDIQGRIEEWQRVARKYPDAVRPLYHLGLAHWEARDLARASSVLKQALALDNCNDQVRGLLGAVLAWQGDLDAALQVSREPAAIEACFADMVANALADSASVLMAQDRAKEASERYRGAIELAPASAAKRYPLLIEALCQAGNYEAAWEEAAVCREAGVKLPAELLEEVAKKSRKAE